MTGRLDAQVGDHWGEPADVARGLAGAWTLDRQIAGLASMAGTATFDWAKDSQRISYHEQGLLRLESGESFRAERRYVFLPTQLGFDVFFWETPEALFHSIQLSPSHGALSGDGEHHCGGDLYLSRYEFRSNGDVSIVHRVAGPRKNYVSKTLLSRLSR
jgi:hypothetical protein